MIVWSISSVSLKAAIFDLLGTGLSFVRCFVVSHCQLSQSAIFDRLRTGKSWVGLLYRVWNQLDDLLRSLINRMTDHIRFASGWHTKSVLHPCQSHCNYKRLHRKISCPYIWITVISEPNHDFFLFMHWIRISVWNLDCLNWHCRRTSYSHVWSTLISFFILYHKGRADKFFHGSL